jgi:predicted amidohydrolase YtcJ
VNGHVGAANSKAFERAKIGQDVGEIAGGGHFGRGQDGKLNGLIYEQPALLRFVDLAIPPVTPSVIAKALTAYAAGAAAAGNTTLHEPGTIQPLWVDGLAKLSNTLPVRLSASFNTGAAEASKAYVTLGPGTRARHIPNSRLSLYGMKFWADGSNQAESAAQSQPYLNSASKGHANYDVSQMAALCRTARDAGWPILIHCQGDAAVEDALDAIEQAYGANPATGLNRIEHATMARPDQIERMKRLGIELSFIPDFVYLYGGAYRDTIFGPERAKFMVPAGAAAQAGIPFTLHSDSPATGLPINPLRHVQTAVTRRCATDGSVVGPDMAITIDQAIRAITVNAARQIGLADTIGTLESGKEADLTILESDPYNTDPSKIMGIRVSETWVAGTKVFG